MRIFFLSVYFYCSNLFFSLPSRFTFSFELFEFLLLWFLVYWIASLSWARVILSIWAFVYLVGFSYVAFSGHLVQSYEIALFFSHIGETFESFFYLMDLFVYPLIFFGTALILIYYIKPVAKPSDRLFYFVLFACIFIPFSINDTSLRTIQAIAHTPISSVMLAPKHSNQETQKGQFTKNHPNIIIIIGESMRYDRLSLFGYKHKTTPQLEAIQDKLSYKPIFANATNTDVALPLFFNGSQMPDTIDTANNLFLLAKNQGYKTHFISAQTNSYLKYITPYLSLSSIDEFKVLNSKNDTDLLKYITHFNVKQSNLFVFHMMGEHSPYTFYEPRFKKFPQDYDNCVAQSDEVLGRIFDFGLSHEIPTLFFSDHGEMLGEEEGFYGHNRFHPSVINVPLITANVKEFASLKNQNDIYALLKYYMGYTPKPQFTENIRINGSMMSGEDGFKEIKR